MEYFIEGPQGNIAQFGYKLPAIYSGLPGPNTTRVVMEIFFIWQRSNIGIIVCNLSKSIFRGISEVLIHHQNPAQDKISLIATVYAG